MRRPDRRLPVRVAPQSADGSAPVAPTICMMTWGLLILASTYVVSMTPLYDAAARNIPGCLAAYDSAPKPPIDRPAITRLVPAP